MLKYIFNVLLPYGVAMFGITFLGWESWWALTYVAIMLVMMEGGRRLHQPPARNAPGQP